MNDTRIIPHHLHSHQDEMNARHKLERDRHDFEVMFMRLKEIWNDHIWLDNHMTEWLEELMGK